MELSSAQNQHESIKEAQIWKLKTVMLNGTEYLIIWEINKLGMFIIQMARRRFN